MASLRDFGSIAQSISRTAAFTIITSLVLYGFYLIGLAIHNVYFSPLAKFPGPRLAAASPIPYTMQLFRGRLTHWVKELHDKYDSDVVRITPNDLSFINDSAWKDLYGHRPGHKPFQKDMFVYFPAPNGINSLLTANDSDHSRMRRLLSHAFSEKALKESQPLVQSYVDVLISQLRGQIRGPAQGKVDFTKWYNWTSFDIIGDLTFGESFDCLKDSQYHPWVRKLYDGIKAMTLASGLRRYPLLEKVLSVFIPKRDARQKHFDLVSDKLERRIKLGAERPDFISHILRHNDEKGLTRPELEANASLLIVAGSETTSTLLCGTTFHLMKNREALGKVTDEVRQAFRTQNEITLQSVSRLRYMLAVLDEGSRMYPAAHSGQPRRVPGGGDMVAGHWLPGNTGVRIDQHAAYQSARNFLDPQSFIPERWLDDPRFASDHKSVLQPFSIGARNCIGKK
ncbi:MAG: hypothetical protein M1836_003386 [Candelina mexicana]|nr:MAG: hypothetical protein M1836_003386 [Candelina mexicana]